ncbi:MAG: serine/threonine protein kinase [Anaerolineales bacterium]|nr:serine/threonine protein kinase [Anaerolineales bacterium]
MLPPLKAGDTLRQRYRIIQPIGQGGMGSIYQAEDLRLEGRLCALKEVQTDPGLPLKTQQQSREQFYREASVLARLDHPNLPKVSDYFSEDTRDYLVMDYVPGRDLKDLMDEARQNGRFLAETEVLSWASQLAGALAYLHEQQPPIVHRDIKPSNLKVTPSGLVKLVDFGLVKLLAPDERTVTVVQGLGTVYYTPLEQYGGDTGNTDARSDIYAFGATLYHLLTNDPPVEAKQRFLRPESLKAPRSVNSSLSLRVEKAILWAMAMHPDDRPPDITTLREALRPDTGPLTTINYGDTIVVQPLIRLPTLATPIDRYLAAIAAGLLFLAFAVTFLLPGR